MDAETIGAAQDVAAVSAPAERRSHVRGIVARFRRGYRRLRRLALGQAVPRTDCPPVPEAPEGQCRVSPGPKRTDGDDLSFAPIPVLARALRRGRVTAEALARLSLARLEEFDPKLRCVASLMPRRALASARRADREFANGKVRGPLHGIPWGCKDILDARGAPTEWGCELFQGRPSQGDAEVVARLEAAGAVLVAKLATGELASGDVWSGGRTRNPFRPRQGSSGSSAGPAAATVAGLVPFALGSETHGSITSPAVRCGAVGLRPTFGTVPGRGCMVLSPSLDKIGAFSRNAPDAALVLSVISDAPIRFDPRRGARGRRIAVVGAVTPAVRRALREAGARLVRATPPELDIKPLMAILYADIASSFEWTTRGERAARLIYGDLWYAARLIPAVEYIQAQRLRTKLVELLGPWMDRFDAVVVPGMHRWLMSATNFTGHPSLTWRTGFLGDRTPLTTTLFGPHHSDGALAEIARSVEKKTDAWRVAPPGFSRT